MALILPHHPASATLEHRGEHEIQHLHLERGRRLSEQHNMYIQSFGQVYALAERARTSKKPVIVFVPESWHDPHCFHLVADLLDNAGYDSILVHNPSIEPEEAPDFSDDGEDELPGGPAPSHPATARYPASSKSTDVNAIREIIENISPYTEIVLFVHGRGAIPTCEAAKGLDVASRKKAGLPGGVRHIVFCCAYLPMQGESIMSAYGEEMLESPDENKAKDASMFYNDLDVFAAKTWLRKLKTYNSSVLQDVCDYAAWQDIPSTYIMTAKDNALPIALQTKMLDKARERADIKQELLEAGHSPFLSVPYPVAQIIQAAAGSG